MQKNIRFEYGGSVSHIPSLDGIRGVAVSLVIAYHVLGFRAGWVGVDLFFVLSGFLITSILIDSKNSGHYFYNFIVKRTLRIFPLYFGVLIAYFGLFASAKGISVFRDSIVYFLYLQNFKFSLSNVWPTDYLYPLNHFWSLAIEEQFYLFFPLVVYFTPFKHLWRVCVLIVIVSLLARLYAVSQSLTVAPYVFTLCRIDSLAIGALGAIYVRKRNTLNVFLLGLFFAVFVLQLVINPDFSDLMNQLYGYSLFGLFFCLLVIASLSESFVLSKWFRSSLLRHLGKYSYGLYVFHHIYHAQLEFLIPRYVSDPLSRSILQVVLTLVSTYVTARLSYQYFELAFLRLKPRFVRSSS